MALGGIEDDHLIYEMGQEIARQCKRLGVHINFAPAVDINTNPNNPVIGFRSFGDNKEKVATLGAAYMRGMQDAGVLASAKHFRSEERRVGKECSYRLASYQCKDIGYHKW